MMAYGSVECGGGSIWLICRTARSNYMTAWEMLNMAKTPSNVYNPFQGLGLLFYSGVDFVVYVG